MLKLRKIYALAVYGSAFLPLVAAAADPDATNLNSFINQIKATLNSVVMPFLMVVATVFFVYAMIMYIRSAGEEQEKMRNMMLWSIIALAVILSLWSLVNILSSFGGVDVIPPGPTI